MVRRASLVLVPLMLLGCSREPEASAPTASAGPEQPAATTSPVPAPDAPYGFGSVAVVMEGIGVVRRQQIADGGARERVEDIAYTDEAKTQIGSHYLTIRVPGTTWLIDLLARTGTKFNTGPGMTVSSGGLDLSRTALHNTFAMYPWIDEGEAVVAGMTCRVYAVGGADSGYSARFSLWRGLALRADLDGMGMTATSVEEVAAFPATVFEVPAGVTITER